MVPFCEIIRDNTEGVRAVEHYGGNILHCKKSYQRKPRMNQLRLLLYLFDEFWNFYEEIQMQSKQISWSSFFSFSLTLSQLFLLHND